MKKLPVFFLLLSMCMSCTKYHDPSIEVISRYYFGFMNAPGQKYMAGDMVDDSLSFYIININGMPYQDALIKFEVISGGGTLSSTDTRTDSLGKAYTTWQLGNETVMQKVRARIFSSEGDCVSSSELYEYGFRKNRWDEFSESPAGSMRSVAADTVNHMTLMVSGGNIYRMGDKYYNWNQVNSTGNRSYSSVDIDRTGVFYIASWDGYLMKSNDGGNSWLSCASPYTDISTTMHLYVANDNSIWAFANTYPTKYSTDGGSTWNIAGGDLSQWGYGDVFRMKDGSLLFHGSDCCSLHRSTDGGATWTPLQTPGYSLKAYVDENDNIYIVTQEGGISIYKSADYGLTFEKLYSVMPLWGTGLDHTFHIWHNTYYILIPGYGILRSDDLIHFTNFWLNENLIDMFITDNGVFIAKDRDMYTIYYYSSL
ncbi:MAG TPA: sialidase family protein [Bacteroidales bacterium]|nr:sialidase family protein [Bacteroidales bacterium]